MTGRDLLPRKRIVAQALPGGLDETRYLPMIVVRSRRAAPATRSYLPVRSRCLHPGQQHGRRWPSSSSSWVRRMRRSRVVCRLASSTQQMNSLRAKGVMSDPGHAHYTIS
jgi:hypothetical protein